VGDRNCSVEQCDRKPYGHGLCQMHYKRMRARGTTDARVFVPKVCKVEGCERRANVPGSARGWCGPHYQRWQRWGDPLGEYAPLIGIAPCAIDGCDDLVKARGWCSRHWDRWSRHGHPTARLRGEVVNGCRICPRCGVDTPIADYSPGQAYCKTCCAAKAAAYRSINPPAPVDGWAATVSLNGRCRLVHRGPWPRLRAATKGSGHLPARHAGQRLRPRDGFDMAGKGALIMGGAIVAGLGLRCPSRWSSSSP
jgi:hypothetical protein